MQTVPNIHDLKALTYFETHKQPVYKVSKQFNLVKRWIFAYFVLPYNKISTYLIQWKKKQQNISSLLHIKLFQEKIHLFIKRTYLLICTYLNFYLRISVYISYLKIFTKFNSIFVSDFILPSTYFVTKTNLQYFLNNKN